MRSSPISGQMPRQALLLLVGLSLLWGTNWPAMKHVLTSVDPWTFRVTCISIGGLGLLLIGRLAGQRMVFGRDDVPMLLLAAFFNVTGWHLFTAFALPLIDAGRASIIAFTMPLWASLAAVVFLNEKLYRRRILGLCIGLVGVALLLLPALQQLGRAPLGLALMLGAAISWALGTIAVKKRGADWSVPPIIIAGWQLLLGGVPVLLGFLAWGRPETLLQLDGLGWLVFAFILVGPMIYCQAAWLQIVSLVPANLAAISTLSIPVIGVFSSAWLLSERIGSAELTALVCVVSALVLVIAQAEEKPP